MTTYTVIQDPVFQGTDLPQGIFVGRLEALHSRGAEGQGGRRSCLGQWPLGPEGQPSVQVSFSLAVPGCSVVSPYQVFLSLIMHYPANALHPPYTEQHGLTKCRGTWSSRAF